MPPRSRHTSTNGIAARSREADRHPSLKTHQTYLTHLPLSLWGKCTGMGEVEPTWIPEAESTWPKPGEPG